MDNYIQTLSQECTEIASHTHTHTKHKAKQRGYRPHTYTHFVQSKYREPKIRDTTPHNTLTNDVYA